MWFKLLLSFCLLYVAHCGYWSKIASDVCVGAKNNQYKEFTYTGRSTFIAAMKLVHKKGYIGCYGAARTNWGCNAGSPTNMIVTDTRNKVMYPSPALVKLRTGGWYDLPGYGLHSLQLVFSDPGFRYLPRWQKMRIWYGEDLFGYTEHDNHGSTCMDVYVYATSNI